MKITHHSHISTPVGLSAMALLGSLILIACTPTKESPDGFILPQGDAMTGQTTFAALGCINCHKVDGVSFTDSDTISPELIVILGGKQPKVKTYGQLVTAIIHPNASILKNDPQYVDAEGQSLMPNYSKLMTVQQMTDLVTFLQEHYEIMIPEYDPRMVVYP